MRLGWTGNNRHIVIKKSKSGMMSIYSSDNPLMWFVLAIPVIGNLIALMLGFCSWIDSIVVSKPRRRTPKEEIVFNSTKKK